MAVKVETPPMIKGTSEEKIKQLASYLWKLSENLNIALNNLDSSNFATEPESQTTSGAVANAKTNSGSYNELRSLITNTATYIRAAETKLERELASNYEAVSSDFGRFTENVTTSITETARNVIAEYQYAARLDALEDSSDEYATYIKETNGYIRAGFIADDDDVPILGIAIGQSVQTTGRVVDGHEEISTAAPCAFYTADGVYFFLNGNKAAHFTNEELEVTNIKVKNALTIGDWVITADSVNGLTIKVR